MSLGIADVVEMKNHTNNLGINGYDYFFMDLENNFLSKLNGTERNLGILRNYNKEAQEFIILQLAHVREEAAAELMNKLGIKRISIAKENQKHIDLDMN